MANPLDSFKGLPSWGKGAVVAGGAGAVYLVYRARQNAAASASSAAAGLSTPDAATGAGTGNGLPVAGPGTVTGATGTTSGFGTLAAWSAAAQAGLAEIGYDPVTVATALGAYLSGQKITSDQAAIVNAARAEFDTSGLTLPPVVLASSSGPASTGNTTPRVSGGHVVSVTGSEAVVGWTGTNAVRYQTRIVGPGPINGHTGTTTTGEAVYGGLQAGHSYMVYVTPVGANGQAGPTGRIDLKTTKGK